MDIDESLVTGFVYLNSFFVLANTEDSCAGFTSPEEGTSCATYKDDAKQMVKRADKYFIY